MAEKQYKSVRGYDMKVRRADSSGPLDYEVQHALSSPGELPEEWEGLKQDETVQEAEIYYSSQRTKRADRRSILDRFIR
jgi:hypothetical protein